MDYAEMVSQIMAAEQGAKALADEAREKRQQMQAGLEKEVSALREDYMDRASHRLEEVRQTEDAAAQDRGRYQRGLKEFYRLFEYIRRQQAHEQHRRQIQPAPYTIIPEILHSCHLCSYFCCGNICSHI